MKDIAESMNKTIGKIVEFFDKDVTGDVGLVSVSKGMNFVRNKDKYIFKKKKKWIHGNFTCRPEIAMENKVDWKMYGDLTTSLIAHTKGLHIYEYFGACEYAQLMDNKGGLQSFDRDQLGRDGYEEIKKDFPKVKGKIDQRFNNFDLDVSAYF